MSLGSFVFRRLQSGWASLVPVAGLPWLPGDALSQSALGSPPHPLLSGEGQWVPKQSQVGSWQQPMEDEKHGSQGTVTKEPSPWNLHLTPACWVVGCQGQGSELRGHDTWAGISISFLLFISHLTQAPLYQVPGPLPHQLSGRVLGQNSSPVRPPLCPPTSSLELSPPKIGRGP